MNYGKMINYIASILRKLVLKIYFLKILTSLLKKIKDLMVSSIFLKQINQIYLKSKIKNHLEVLLKNLDFVYS